MSRLVLILIDGLWTAFEVDKKKRFTPLALYVIDIHIWQPKENVLLIPLQVNCPDSSIGNKAKRFPTKYVCCSLQRDKYRKSLAQNVLVNRSFLQKYRIFFVFGKQRVLFRPLYEKNENNLHNLIKFILFENLKVMMNFRYEAFQKTMS